MYGYASLFNVPDLLGDVVRPGAFARTLARRSLERIAMRIEHDPTRRCGCWTAISEDQSGLLVEGHIDLDTPAGAEAARMIGSGTLRGFSIGFRTLGSEKAGGKRLLFEVDLWEISLVGFPALPAAWMSVSTLPFEVLE